MTKTSFLKTFAAMMFAAIFLSSCTPTTSAVRLSGTSSIRIVNGTFVARPINGDGDTQAQEMNADVIRVTIEKTDVSGPIGIVILEDTSYVEIDYSKLDKIGEVNSDGMEVETTESGSTLIKVDGATVYTLDDATCSPFYLKKNGTKVEIWVPKGCEHKP